MPDTRTVRERATELFEEYPGTPWEECVYAAAQKLGVMDALIGCQGRVVYTAEDVEAVRAAMAPYLYGEAFADLEFLDHIGEEKLLAMARVAITAAGGVVVDEVVKEHGDSPIYLGWTSAERTETVTAESGDILYIVRAKEE